MELTPAVDWPVAVCGERSLRERPQPPRLSFRFEHLQSSLLETELSQVMMEFPFAPFSVIQVHPTVDGDEALKRLTETMGQMLAAMGG